MASVLVTGAGGTVGTQMGEALRSVGLEALSYDHSGLDVTDPRAVANAVSSPGLSSVVHLAAETDVDACEVDREHAVAVNVMGTEYVAAACRSRDILLIYVSTGGVFGGYGTDGPFHELDVPRPANWYASTKLAGEHAAARAARYVIVRAGWIVGGGLGDPKFVGRMLRLMERERRVRAVGDRLGTLTFATELADFAAALAARALEGVWHFSSVGTVSRYDIAVELASALGLDVEVERVPHDTFPAPAPRGRSEALMSVRPFGDLPPPSEWRTGLRSYLAAAVRTEARLADEPDSR
jgi:dTDP-4-dehydrorhamnose reductase